MLAQLVQITVVGVTGSFIGFLFGLVYNTSR